MSSQTYGTLVILASEIQNYVKGKKNLQYQKITHKPF